MGPTGRSLDSTKTGDRTAEKGRKESEFGEDRVVKKRRTRETRDPIAKGRIHFRSIVVGLRWRTGVWFFMFLGGGICNLQGVKLQKQRRLKHGVFEISPMRFFLVFS